MPNKTLIRNYESKMGSSLKPFVESALKIFNNIDPKANFYTRDVFHKVQAIALFLSEFPWANKSKRQNDLFIEFSPDNFIRSAEELKKIKPELEKLRIEVFGNISPPFKDLKEANQKIKIEAKRQGEERTKNYPKEKFSYFQYSKLPIGKTEILIYPKTKFALLATETRRLSESTSFSQASLAAAILTGMEPIARVYKISLGTTIDLRIYRSLTDRELKSLIKSIKTGMKSPRKRLTEKHLRLYKFFEEHGQPPIKGKMQFWEDMFKEWRRFYPRDEINSPRALMMAWRRLSQYLRQLK